jgi:putative ABC transport system permease protein
MRLLDIVYLRFRSLFRRRRLDIELDDELGYHIERQIEEDIRRGIDAAEVRGVVLCAVFCWA